MRALAILVLLGGCRQILGFDEPVITAGQDALTDGVDDGPPADADLRARKKEIAIDPAKITAGLLAFPVWLVLDDADLAAKARADGSDIHFTRLDGTPLPYELQRWSPITGHVEAWIRLDLDPTAKNAFELRYGGQGTPPAADPPAVFSNNFAAVWHFEDTLATTTIVDTTGARNGTAMGMASTAQVAARLGGGLSFDGADDRVDFVNPLANNTPHTISVWIDARTGANTDSIMTVGNANTNQSRWFHARYLNESIAVGFFENDFDDINVNIQNDGPTLLHWVFEGGSRISRMYRDGVQIDQHTHNANINTSGSAGFIGFAPIPWGANPCHLNGTLDELRIATVARSAAYIATEFANQSSPSTFYSVGPEAVIP